MRIGLAVRQCALFIAAHSFFRYLFLLSHYTHAFLNRQYSSMTHFHILMHSPTDLLDDRPNTFCATLGLAQPGRSFGGDSSFLSTDGGWGSEEAVTLRLEDACVRLSSLAVAPIAIANLVAAFKSAAEAAEQGGLGSVLY